MRRIRKQFSNVLVVLMTIAMFFSITSNLNANTYIPNTNTYQSDEDALALDFVNMSINDHTELRKLWVQDNIVLVAINSTHELTTVSFEDVDALELKEHAVLQYISINDSGLLDPRLNLNGSVHKSRWTIAAFPLSIVTDTGLYKVHVKGIGIGHDVTADFQVVIPKATVTVNKTWINGPKHPVSVQLVNRVLDEEYLAVNTTDITNPVTLTADSEGKASYTWSLLPRTNGVGLIFDYSIKEADPGQGYIANSITTYNASTFNYVINLTNIYTRMSQDLFMEKIWQGGKASPISINLYRQLNDEEKVLVDTVTLDGIIDSDEDVSKEYAPFKYVWKNIEHTDDNGDTYWYSVDEVSTPLNFTKIIGEGGLTITNIYVSPKTSISGSKVWVNGPSVKPNIQVQLYRNGIEHLEPITLVSGETDFTFENLDLTDTNGDLYTYTFDEVLTPDHYIKTLSEDTRVITNTYASNKISVTANKIWVNGPTVKPAIEIQLYRNNEAYLDAVKLEGDIMSHTWTNLDESDINGVLYTYTVDEVLTPENYAKTLSEDQRVITNTYVSPKTSISGSKVWINGPSVKPDIEIQLYRNGIEHLEPITLVNGETEFTFENLDLTDSNGNLYTYTFDEVLTPDHYIKTFSEDQRVIFNTYVSPLIDVVAYKEWINGPSDHPEIMIQLFRNNEAYLTPVRLGSNETLTTWYDLDKTDNNGVDYIYTVDELTVLDNYRKFISDDGLTITNTFVPSKIDVTVRKLWINGPSIHPNIELQLFRNGEAYLDSIVLVSGVNNFTFEDLDKTDINGVEYVYSVDEITTFERYSKSISSDGLTITNTYVEEKIPKDGGEKSDVDDVVEVEKETPIKQTVVDKVKPTTVKTGLSNNNSSFTSLLSVSLIIFGIMRFFKKKKEDL